MGILLKSKALKEIKSVAVNLSVDAASKIINKNTRWLTLPFWMAYCFLPMAYCTAKLTGSRPSFSRGSLHALAVQAKKISSRKVDKEFNFKARPLEETIRDTINWIKEHVD